MLPRPLTQPGPAPTDEELAKKREPKLKPWPQDVLRHTGISCHYRLHGDEGLTAAWAGNSPDTIHSHYRALVSAKDAEAFFEIRPKVKRRRGRGKIIAIDMHGIDPIPAVTIFKKDFLEEDAPQLLIDALGGEKVDVVLSDMAAHATGHRQTDHILVMTLAEAGLDFACQMKTMFDALSTLRSLHSKLWR